jgi:hypothetical protein
MLDRQWQDPGFLVGDAGHAWRLRRIAASELILMSPFPEPSQSQSQVGTGRQDRSSGGNETYDAWAPAPTREAAKCVHGVGEALQS